MIRTILILAVIYCASLMLAGCSEPTQKEAQDSQAQIQKEMKASGDDKNAY